MRDVFLRSCALLALVAPVACLKIPDDLTDSPDSKVSAPSTAAEVLDRYVKALGGKPKLETITQRTTEARMVVHADPGCEDGDETCRAKDEVGSFLLTTTASGRMYRRTVFGKSVEERGYDGKTGWNVGADGLLRIDTKLEAINTAEDALLHPYFGVESRGIEVTLMSPRKADSEGNAVDLDGLQWRVKGDETAKTMWFERATGLLREEITEEGAGADLQRQILTFGDYQKVDGVLVPFKIQVSSQSGKQTQVIDFLAQRVSHDPIDASKFEVPKLSAPKPTPDPLVDELDRARKAAKDAPKDAAAQVGWARVAFADAEFDEATRACEATLAIDPREPEALFTLARIQMLRGELDAALRTLGKAGKNGVREDQIARQLAWIHMRRRDYAALARALDDAGSPVMAGRYRTFVGKPFTIARTPGCVAKPKMVSASPLLIAEIEVEGTPTAAILDTGAAEVILSESFAKELGVVVRAKSQLGPQGPEVSHGQVDRLAIGGVELTNVPVVVFSDQTIADMAGPDAKRVKSVIGMHALSDMLVTIDVPNKTVELVAPGAKCKAEREARRSGTAVPFVLHESHYIYAAAMLGPAKGLYLFNTGMRGADLTATQAAYGFAGIGAPPLRADEVPMVTLDSFRVGDVEFNGLAAAYGFFERSQTTDGFRLDGMVGLGTIGRRRFTLDYDKQRMYFAPASPG